VWQLISLVIACICSHLLPPILIIEQGSLCVSTAFVVWFVHFIFFRYIPITLNLFLLWIVSIIDIFVCLHHRGCFYNSSLTNEMSMQRKECLSGVYYVKGVDKWETSISLGLGDFLVYNILILLVVPPSSSIIIKMCVTLGSIISVQVGFLLTYWLCSLIKKMSTPGVPLSVITVSIYLFILNIIIPTNLNQCIGFWLITVHFETNELFSANKSKIPIHSSIIWHFLSDVYFFASLM